VPAGKTADTAETVSSKHSWKTTHKRASIDFIQQFLAKSFNIHLYFLHKTYQLMQSSSLL